MKAFTTGPFTGRHIGAIMVAFFAVIVAVNFLMAYFATATFGGVVVENSYVAGQHFNRWLDQAERDKALGWSTEVRRTADNRIALVLRGAPVGGLAIAGTARHPLGHMPDQLLRFRADGSGGFVSDQPLPAGRWRIRLQAEGAAVTWRKEIEIS